ncbi:hypothetical protein DBR42_29460 [Pelomonas sp. HMWF004]|nr:hypothetical protein DBR42_29460 [Pelomonas sp. HMWF004]
MAGSIWASASTLNSLEATADAAYALAAGQGTVTLIVDGSMTVVGNTAQKTAGLGWDASVRSRDSFTGGAYVSWVHPDPAAYSFGFGLNTDPTTNASFDTIDFWFYNSGTTLNVFNNSSFVTGFPGAVAAGDVLAVTYDGSVVRYLRNGQVLYSQTTNITSPLFLDSSFDTVGGRATNIQFGPLSSNAWTSIGGRPKSYRVGAYGQSATGYPVGSVLLDADSNTQLIGTSPMYVVAKIHRITKAVTNLGAFNPLGGGLSECNAMAAALNSIDSLHVCVVFTYDEPATNRLLGNLPAAMYRNGASRVVWGSAAFRYRGAYILVGYGGCGEGNGAECYAGAVNSDPGAWCDITFQLTELGALIVSGTTRGATTLLDLDYVGDRDATRGAPTGTYVGSNLAQDLETLAGAQTKADAAANWAASTSQTYAAAQANLARLQAQAYADGVVDAEEARAIEDASNKAEAARVAAVNAAATDATAKAAVAATTANWIGVSGAGRPTDLATRSIVTQDNYSFGGAGVANGANRSFTVTPPANCMVSFSATIVAGSVSPDAGNYLEWRVSAGGGADVLLGICNGGAGRLMYSCIASFVATGGVALTFKLVSDRASGNPVIVLFDSSMRVEQVIAP